MKKNFEVVTPDDQVVTDGTISDDVLVKLKSGRCTCGKARLGEFVGIGEADLSK